MISEIAKTHPDVQFLALSVSDAPEDVIATIRAGARGYVTKTIAPDELLDAIARVRGGDAVFSPRLAGFVLDAFADVAPAAADPELDQLTPREREVLRLIARGYAYKEVARSRHLGQDRREPRLVGPAQAPAVEPASARPLGVRSPPHLRLRRALVDGLRAEASLATVRAVPLPLRPPFEPMLAKLTRELPPAGDVSYEPKWDGFRCIVFRDGDELDLQSRNQKPLLRYFPELREPLLEAASGSRRARR